jgi:hypothetical protein
MSRTTLGVLAAATIGVAFVANASLIDVPKSLGPIDDSQTPAAIVSSGRTGQAVVWLGRVESATVRKEGGRVVLEWVCRHLPFAEPSERAIERSPIRFTPGKSGYFVVNLVANMPAETAESVSTDLIHAGKYILVAGRAAAIVRRGGKDAVFLHTEQMLQSDEIAEPAKQAKSQEQQAIRAAKRISVNVLDAGLPDKPFASWFRSVAGPQATIEWEVNDCGEQSGTPDDTPDAIPMCAQATAHIASHKTAVVSICVGTFVEGVSGRPALFWTTVDRDGVVRNAIKLSALPDLLRD